MSAVAQRVVPNAEPDSAKRQIAVLRRSNVFECARCGNQELERRTGWFKDADYHELLQEYFELEASLKIAMRDLLRAQSKLGTALEDIERMHSFEQAHLWPLALAQLRVMAAMLPEDPA